LEALTSCSAGLYILIPVCASGLPGRVHLLETWRTPIAGHGVFCSGALRRGPRHRRGSRRLAGDEAAQGKQRIELDLIDVHIMQNVV
jgi:hypothetical protein